MTHAKAVSTTDAATANTGCATTVVLDSGMDDEVVGKVLADLGTRSEVRMFVPLGKLTMGGGSHADTAIQLATSNGSTRLVVVAFLSEKLDQLLRNRGYTLADRIEQVRRYLEARVPAGAGLEVSILTVEDPNRVGGEDTS